MTSTLYRREIEGAGHEHGLDPDLLEALVIIESSGQADAFKHEPGFYARYLAKDPRFAGQVPRRVASSYGLMQVMYTTALDHDYPYPEPEYLFVPAINLEMGARVLAALLEWADGAHMKALAGYNGGKGNWLGLAPQAYSKKVNRVLEAIQAERR